MSLQIHLVVLSRLMGRMRSFDRPQQFSFFSQNAIVLAISSPLHVRGALINQVSKTWAYGFALSLVTICCPPPQAIHRARQMRQIRSDACPARMQLDWMVDVGFLRREVDRGTATHLFYSIQQDKDSQTHDNVSSMLHPQRHQSM